MTLMCPRGCASALTADPIGGMVRVQRCSMCRGSLIAVQVLRDVASLDVPSGTPEWRLEAVDESPLLQCPVCTEPMRRTSVAGASLHVDTCSEHGIWFDEGELERAAAHFRVPISPPAPAPPPSALELLVALVRWYRAKVAHRFRWLEYLDD